MLILPATNLLVQRALRRCWAFVLASAMLGGLGALPNAAGSDLVMTEPQVKALCLLNFAKYISWPAEAFATTNAPIRIAIAGDERIHQELERAAKNKVISGRPVLVLDYEDGRVPENCHMLFIGATQKSRTQEILKAVSEKPTITVGDADDFADRGGVIMFVKRENKVRFEVNLKAARAAQLQISSRLLALADAVRGKE
ncbi:MAG TPA: YfiR family protein [Verrucomicrobiae bacterium]|nr:YfiR family protein [Verrucomicrobiae bacterium]